MTSTSRLRVSDDISKLVGETPMLQMKKLAPAGSADIFAKLEYLNPGGSVKDRAAIGLIERAEREGKLKRGGTVIEATAGNTGIGLALIGVSRGYKVRLFVPEKFSEEKVIIMRALGAEVTRTPEAEGMQGAIQRAKDLLATDPAAFMAAQFENPANPDYHYETTAREIFEQMEGRIDAVTVGSGTAGTFTGIARFSERAPAERAYRSRWKPKGPYSAEASPARTKWKGSDRASFPKNFDRFGLQRNHDGDRRSCLRHGERACRPRRRARRLKRWRQRLRGGRNRQTARGREARGHADSRLGRALSVEEDF